MAKVNVDGYKEQLWEAGILETDCHRVFAGGQHGQKLCFEVVRRGTPLYRRGIKAKVEKIGEIPRQGKGIIAILGIAEGTNQEALDVADYRGGRTVGLQTEKVNKKSVRLTQIARRVLMAVDPGLVVLSEDASTRGTVCASVVPEIRSLGVENIAVVTTWQRQPELPALDRLGVPYYPLIQEYLPTYSFQECRVQGFCHDEIPLKQHGETK